MRELNIATFIQIVQVGLKEHDKQFAAGEFLLEALNRSDDERFSGYYEILSDKKISKLVNRQSPVPDGTQQASLIPELAADAVRYYETKVVDDLNPFRKDDVLSQLAKVIREDTEIGDKKRNELLKIYDDGKEGTFLGELFLYVVNRPNVPDNEFVGYEDAPLIGEANYECPLCHNKLVDTVKGKPVKRFEITQIFPEGLTQDRKKELAAVCPKPKDLDSPDNLIALCARCSEEYLSDPTAEEYKSLLDVKKLLSRNFKAKEAVDAIELEENIRVVIDALTQVDDSVELVPLEYEAIHIDKKIDRQNFILKNEIQIKVLQYYRYIEKIFSESETDFDLIASEVKTCSMKLEKSGMSQQDIIEYLADWIRNKTSLGTESKTACSVVVAFFIQNCEVFYKNEVPK